MATSSSGIHQTILQHIADQFIKHLPDLSTYLAQAQASGLKPSPQVQLAIGFISMLASLLHFGVKPVQDMPPPIELPPQPAVPPTPAPTPPPVPEPPPAHAAPYYDGTPASELTTNPHAGTAAMLGFKTGDIVWQLLSGKFIVEKAPSAGVLHEPVPVPDGAVNIGPLTI